MDSRFDDLLHTVIAEKGQGIYGFFDVVFGFMYRRTDFFYEMAPGENMGFFPGQAEAIVYNYLRKYQNVHFKERVPKRNIDPKEIEDFMKKQKEQKESKQAKPEPEKIDTNTEKKSEILIPMTKVETQKVKTETKVSGSANVSTTTSQPVPSQSNSKVTPISVYNGDSCENYNWSQGVIDVTIQIVLPPNTNKQMVRISIHNYN
jgi:hypothetical protein